MMDLRELYQEIIIDHNRNPRNHRVMECPSCLSQGFNPLCGDKLTLYLQLEQDIIRDISFIGKGCAISQASASLMTDALKGKTKQEAQAIFEDFHQMLTLDDHHLLSSAHKLAVFAGVKAYPARVKCATLAWHTFRAALQQEPHMVSTE